MAKATVKLAPSLKTESDEVPRKTYLKTYFSGDTLDDFYQAVDGINCLMGLLTRDNQIDSSEKLYFLLYPHMTAINNFMAEFQELEHGFAEHAGELEAKRMEELTKSLIEKTTMALEGSTVSMKKVNAAVMPKSRARRLKS